MKLSDFEELNKHLIQIGPIFDSFCSRNGFEYLPKKAIGRYPRIRIEKQLSDMTVWLDLWMESNSSGERFSKFFPEIPYELSAGVFFDIKRKSKGFTRYHKSILCFSSKPFIDLPEKKKGSGKLLSYLIQEKKRGQVNY